MENEKTDAYDNEHIDDGRFLSADDKKKYGTVSSIWQKIVCGYSLGCICWRMAAALMILLLIIGRLLKSRRKPETLF